MSFVSLFNLFEKDKNFYGLLDGALDVPATIVITKFAERRIREDTRGLISKLNGKPLREMIRGPISGPEWTLNYKGKFANYGMFEIDDEPRFENLLEINILDWLAALPDERLKAISDCGWIGWRCKADGTANYPTCHPKWGIDDFWKSKVRLLKAQADFFDIIKKKRASIGT